MTPILMSAVALVSFAPPDAARTSPANLDGSWTVLCYEKDGSPVPEAKKMTVTVKDNVATFATVGEDKKPISMKFAFGPQATIRVIETDAASAAPAADPKAAAGVYVLTNDFLAICLHDAADGNNGQNAATGERPQTKSKCSVILQRTAGK